MNVDQTIEWLLEGAPSIPYQAWRDLLGNDKTDLQNRIATEGWGLRFLSERHPDGHCGDHFYQPKWISTHYFISDLGYVGRCRQRNLLEISRQDNTRLQETTGNRTGVLNFFIPGGFERNLPSIVKWFEGNGGVLWVTQYITYWYILRSDSSYMDYLAVMADNRFE